MKDEYDFSDAEQGRFYRPIEELEIPVYLDKEIRQLLMQQIQSHKTNLSLSAIVNNLIKQDIEISRQLAL